MASTKKFKGSLAVLILLVICCWPAAIIYFFIKREELRLCQNCGHALDEGLQVCPKCNTPTMMGPTPQQQYQQPPPR